MWFLTCLCKLYIMHKFIELLLFIFCYFLFIIYSFYMTIFVVASFVFFFIDNKDLDSCFPTDSPVSDSILFSLLISQSVPLVLLLSQACILFRTCPFSIWMFFSEQYVLRNKAEHYRIQLVYSYLFWLSFSY